MTDLTRSTRLLIGTDTVHGRVSVRTGGIRGIMTRGHIMGGVTVLSIGCMVPDTTTIQHTIIMIRIMPIGMAIILQDLFRNDLLPDVTECTRGADDIRMCLLQLPEVAVDVWVRQQDLPGQPQEFPAVVYEAVHRVQARRARLWDVAIQQREKNQVIPLHVRPGFVQAHHPAPDQL